MKRILAIALLSITNFPFSNPPLNPPPIPEEKVFTKAPEPKLPRDQSREIASFYSKSEWVNRCSIEVDSRIRGKTAATVIPWRDDTRYLPKSWAYGLNLTAVAMAKTSPRPVAITPKPLVSTKHYGWHPQPGQTIRFLTLDNRIISRLVDQVKYLGSSDNTVIDKDVAVIRLTEDLPGGITPMKLISKNALEDLIQYSCPVLRIDQENKALLVEASSSSHSLQTLGFMVPYANSSIPRVRSYSPYYESMITGDSSSSSILLYRDSFGVTPFLVSQVTYGGVGSGPNTSVLSSEIQAVINGFGDSQPKYQLVFGPYEYTGHKPPHCSITASRIGTTGNCSISVQGSGDSTTGNPNLLPNVVSSWTKSGNIWTATAACSTTIATSFAAQLTGPGGTGPKCGSGEVKPIEVIPPMVSSISFNSLTPTKIYPSGASRNNCVSFQLKVLDQYQKPMSGITLQLGLSNILNTDYSSWGQFPSAISTLPDGTATGSFCANTKVGAAVLVANYTSSDGKINLQSKSSPITIAFEPNTDCAYCSSSVTNAPLVTPGQWLKNRVAPRFYSATTLPPLSRWGWALPLDVRQELADRWGYALEFGGYVTTDVVNRALNDSNSDEAKVLDLMVKNPGKYKLAAILSRWEPGLDSPNETWLRDANGNFLLSNGNRVFSPEMPISVLNRAASERAEPLRLLHQKVPISVLLNGGEYMIGVPGWIADISAKDPSVVAAKGNKSWQQYISERKARESTIIADAVRSVTPDRDLYIFYPLGGSGRLTFLDAMWTWLYELMKPAADYSSESLYFRDYNAGFVGGGTMLGQALANRGYELKFGNGLSYHWSCAGWEENESDPTTFKPTGPPNPNGKSVNAGRPLADLRLYEGYLKSLYTSGAIGAVAGYFGYPKGGFSAQFPESMPPHWLQQMVVHSHVHAQFSYLESFLRDGDLLPGTTKSYVDNSQPAYELATGDWNLHVLVRKRTQSADWLIVAWAADGVDRTASVNVPGLGTINVLGRAIGSIYLGRLEGNTALLTQIDDTEN